MERTNASAKRFLHSLLVCRICGDVARGMNFNVMSCMSCKAFFRRNALRPQGALRCARHSSCEVTLKKRVHCAACRLKKCFACGMKPQMIRSFTESNFSTPQPVALLTNDRSSLSADQWTLLSNIVHAYDGQHLADRQKSLLSKRSSLPFKFRAKSLFTLEYLQNNLAWMESFLTRSPHFQSLPTATRQIVITHNISLCASLNGIMFTRTLNLLDDPFFLLSFDALFGREMLNKILVVHKRLDHSDLLVKLLLFILAFSSNCSPVTSSPSCSVKEASGALDLVYIQDIYITLFWKYLLYQYGLIDAISRYSAMIKMVVDLIAIKEQMAHFSTYDDMVDTTMKQIEHSFIIKDENAP